MRTIFGNVILGFTTVVVTTLVSFLFLTTHYRFEEGLDIEKIALSVVQVGAATEPSTQISTVGSGVIVTNDGYILTVKHNVVGRQHLFVKTSDGRAIRTRYALNGLTSLPFILASLPPSPTKSDSPS